MNLIGYDGQIELEEDDWAEDYDPEDNDPEDEWECEFGERCLMPGYYHRRDECYTVEMAEEWEREKGIPQCGHL